MSELNDLYYIQRKPSGYLGNSPIWWAIGDCGYTAYLQNAKKFDYEEAKILVGKGSDKYAMYKCSEIEKRLHLVFDMQDFKYLGTNEPCGFTGGSYAKIKD